METPSDKMIDMIRKLLALGSNNPNPHEAEVAMRRAHKLLAKYNLDLEMVKGLEGKDSDPYVHEKVYVPAYQGGAGGRQIAGAIARLYFCKMIYSNVRNGEVYFFVGRKTNVAITRDIVETVVGSLRKQAQLGKNLPGYITNFMNQAANEIYHRTQKMILESMKGQSANDAGTCNLPATRDLYASSEEMINKYMPQLAMTIKIRKPDLRGGQGDYGTVEGSIAGRTVNLRPTLANTNKRESLK